METMRLMIRQSHGLRYLSHSPKSTSRILTLFLDDDEDADEMKGRKRNLGSELSVRLETLHHIDTLIDVVRKRGETGCQTYAEESIDSTDPNDAIYKSLFGLTRLVLDPQRRDCYGPWVADVIASKAEDYILPLLILLESFDRQERLAKTKSVDSGIGTHTSSSSHPISTYLAWLRVVTAQSLAAIPVLRQYQIIFVLVSSSMSSSDAKMPPTPQSLLSRLDLSDDRLEVSTLLSTVAICVLRYAEETQYLLRYGPRLLELIPRKYFSPL